MKGIKIQNMVSSRGNSVANQFELFVPGVGTIFQSYTSVIAIIDPKGGVTLDENKWDYSVTTSRYRNKFLGEDTTETKKKIKSGEYKLEDLN